MCPKEGPIACKPYMLNVIGVFGLGNGAAGK